MRSPRIAAARSSAVASARQAREASRDRRARSPRGPSSRTCGACSAVGASPSRQTCVEQRDQEERIAARACLQRGREGRVGLGSEALAGKRRGRLLAEAAGANQRRRRGPRAAPRRALGGWPAREGACRQAAGAAALRADGRDNEASAATARRPSAGRRRRAASGCARRSWRPASRGRAASRTRTRLPLRTQLVGADANSDALSPAAPASSSARSSGVARGERRLEQLPHDPERELALQLAAARGQDLELGRLGERARLRQAAASSRSRRCPRRRPAGRRPTRAAPSIASSAASSASRSSSEAGRSSVSAASASHRDPPAPPVEGRRERRLALRRALATDTLLSTKATALASAPQAPQRGADSRQPLRAGVGSSVGSPRTRTAGARAQSRRHGTPTRKESRCLPRSSRSVVAAQPGWC